MTLNQIEKCRFFLNNLFKNRFAGVKGRFLCGRNYFFHLNQSLIKRGQVFVALLRNTRFLHVGTSYVILNDSLWQDTSMEQEEA